MSETPEQRELREQNPELAALVEKRMGQGRRRTLMYSAVVCLIVAFVVARGVNVESVNRDIRDDNELCQGRTTNIGLSNELRDKVRENWQKMAEAHRKSAIAWRTTGLLTDNDDLHDAAITAASTASETADDLQVSAAQLGDLEPADCDPNQPEVPYIPLP